MEPTGFAQSVIERLPAGWDWRPPLVVRSEQIGAAEPQRVRYEKGGGCSQRLRSRDPTQAGYYDVKHYERVVTDLRARLGENPLVVDLGCGDGRVIEMLIRNRVSRIVAQDFNAGDLEALAETLNGESRDRVLLVHASIADEPLLPGVADAALLIEVACCLTDPMDAYRAAHRWLRPNGYAIVANVAREAYLVHALLNGDFEQVQRVAEGCSYLDRVGGEPVSVHLYHPARMSAELESLGFERIERRVIPAGPALLMHARRTRSEPDERFLALVRSVAAAEIGIPRVHVDLVRKTE